MSATRGTILIVENNEPLREAMADLFEDEGFAVRQASDGAEALALLRCAPLPSLIVLDLMMPVMDGPAFRAQQLKDAALRQVPVLVVTADKRHDEAYYAALGDAWLLKPFSIDELVATVARLTRRGTARIAQAA
jgi:CheY-like chemotaxis protein